MIWRFTHNCPVSLLIIPPSYKQGTCNWVRAVVLKFTGKLWVVSEKDDQWVPLICAITDFISHALILSESEWQSLLRKTQIYLHIWTDSLYLYFVWNSHPSLFPRTFLIDSRLLSLTFKSFLWWVVLLQLNWELQILKVSLAQDIVVDCYVRYIVIIS